MNDSDETAKNDFELARQNYHELIIKGQDALDEMIEVARASEHPRAFEVLSTLMKSVADVNGDLLALHRKKKDYNKTDQKALPAGVTTNNLFVGSTTELQKMLKDVNSDRGDNVIDITSRRSDDGD
tara:strand:- start:1251 stop:1628 length:378 start_codon:yes stop_codon:yes gene_type:complete